jgi:hypothetical protein
MSQNPTNSKFKSIAYLLVAIIFLFSAIISLVLGVLYFVEKEILYGIGF